MPISEFEVHCHLDSCANLVFLAVMTYRVGFDADRLSYQHYATFDH